MRIDHLGLVAQARASMMMRGYEPLCLIVGPAFWRGLVRADPSLAPLENALGEDVAEILGMPTSVRAYLEGFAVKPAPI